MLLASFVVSVLWVSRPWSDLALLSQTQSKLIIVAGDSYQGAIIPADLALSRAASWTPTPDDVSIFEKQVGSYFERAARFPKNASPRLRRGRQFVEALEVHWIVANLRDFRRQYVGTEERSQKRIELTAFLESPRTSKWREAIILPPFDSACGFWFMTFDLRRLQILEAWCGGSP
jgi:hypothetical protein